jgi:hypothetical protein
MATTDNFFDVFDTADANGHYGNVSPYLMAQFSNAPSVGIASGAGPVGPQFSGVGPVTTLFNRLFSCLQNLSYTSVGPFCSNANTTIVQATLGYDFMKNPWFQKGEAAVGHYHSKPLSDIKTPTSAPTALNPAPTVPTCAVFTFDTDTKIVRLGIYMDRWKMAVDLWDGTYDFSKPDPK